MPDPSPDRTPHPDASYDAPFDALADVDDLLYGGPVGEEGYGDENDAVGLDAQIQARLRASMEDARAQAPNRMAAAAKAVALLIDERDAEAAAAPTVTAPPPVPVPPTPPAPAPPRPALVAVPSAPAPDEVVDLHPSSTGTPPVVPTGGPAAAVSSAYAASRSTAQSTPRPLFELRPLAGGHPDPRGENLLVFAERLEHRDRHGRLRQRVSMRDVTTVTTARRLTGASVTIECRTGTDLVMKGLRPEEADEIRRIVLATKDLAAAADPGYPEPSTPELPSSPATTSAFEPAPTAPVATLDEADLLSKLIDLHRAGVLDEAELAAKTAIVGQLVQRAAGRP
ncbi:MAG: hypothetical protein MUE36_13365 [Acidimicrobiales bacterium]|nr:hypothetical protein [Acidimicrobiales bacterium]